MCITAGIASIEAASHGMTPDFFPIQSYFGIAIDRPGHTPA